MTTTYRYILKLLPSVALLVLMAVSCTDEDITRQQSPDINEIEGDYLQFKVNLQGLTRDGSGSTSEVDEDYEDYIDKDKLQVLFFYADEFDKDGQPNGKYNTLFEKFSSNEITLIPITDTYSKGTSNWYIRIPIGNYNGTFSTTIRENNFKIAVLANWPDGLSMTKETDSQKGANINDLHRQKVDNAYIKENKTNVYDCILDNKNQMGLTTSWVIDGEWNDEEKAEQFIRDNCYPEGPEAEKYGHLWQYWNFDYAYSNPTVTEDGTNHDKWVKQNYDDLHSWIIAKDGAGKLGNFPVISGNNQEPKPITDNFTFIGGDAYYDTEKKGIVLPAASGDNINNKDVIKFTIPATGKLIVKWGSADGNSAKIKIDRRNFIDDSTPKDSKQPPSITSNLETTPWDMTITGNEEHISLYSGSGNVIIYSIEYIGYEYLGYIDRKGKNPKDQPIPMYGVQIFDKLGNNWIEGAGFDLSNFNMTSGSEYKYKNISLLRSVAKVVLKIPIKEKPKDVFLRCMNRKAFCEPMDVSTPTDLLWEDDGEFSKHNENCEFFKIIGQQPFYKGADYSVDAQGQLASYKDKLTWYYGAWGLNPNNPVVGMNEINHLKFQNFNDKAETKIKDFREGYPHILNPMIDRSDFCEFLYAGQVDGIYEKYVLYIPEKFVDDPNDVYAFKDNNGSPELIGMESSDPKVIHIEFRTHSYPDKNLEDDYCYRIYFTENGFNSTLNGVEDKRIPPTFKKDQETGVYDTWENSYEKDIENLKVHWPIMRNHIYSFTVLDTSKAMLVVQLEVLPWKEVEENKYNW